jgi:hypothetical protein
MTTPKGFTKIAEIGNDSGTMCIVDPCYVEDRDPNPPHRQKFMNDLQSAMSDMKSYPVRKDVRGLAAVFSTGWGDGVYPVFAKIKDGRIAEVRIQFMDEGDE